MQINNDDDNNNNTTLKGKAQYFEKITLTKLVASVRVPLAIICPIPWFPA